MTGQGPIVFPTDFSAASLAGLPWAKRLTRFMETQLHVIYAAVEPQIFRVLEIEVGQAVQPSVDELITGAETRLQAFVAAHLDGLDLPVIPRILVGNPADEIIQYADEVAAAMIVIGAHGYSGVRHLILGSTTESTLQHAQCPVLCVKAE
ncbi:MAG TPA: universal stress protein [Gammaproteobacteria bacterium]|jgi:nucleotide-binding universal stress UspA family protein|nr:universal stress protein [Gammaproteobacteria bacterium]MDP7153672.1 universal stress protein [Gammaproteobacteria bacterium]MDP7296946.1 universal stress protein [Gammaproteobacteria bacterium]MDP7659644.1 universal stress protein [Gammaproteobacteria bacterium]HJP37710.1 universal stress protein [Gammaproteobacteria bacterium]